MKFTSAAISIAALQLSSVLGAAVIAERFAPDQGSRIGAAKYEGINPVSPHDGSTACRALSQACTAGAKSTTYIWHKAACVASTTCQGVAETLTLAQCANNAIPVQNATSELSTNIYSQIVGGKAGASMTQQNFVDFVYSTLSAINSTQWPTNAQYVVDQWWTPLNKWTNTGAVVPYNNFNDFLHYSTYNW